MGTNTWKRGTGSFRFETVRTPLLIAVLVGVPATALAHQTPAVLGAAGPAVDPLALVRLSHGLARRGDDGRYRYVCPAAWGGPERPPTAGGYVFGVGGVYRFADDGRLDRTDPLTSVLVAGASEAGVFAAVRGEPSSVYRVDGSAAEIHTQAGLLDGLAADAAGVLVAGGEVGGGLILVTIPNQGSTTTDRYAAGLDGAFVTPRRVGTSIWIRARGPAETRIGRIEGDAVEWIVTSTSSLFGPDAALDEVRIVHDGRLVALEQDVESVIDDTRRYTCLDRGFVCTLRALYRVDDRGAPVFELDTVLPPDLTGVEDEVGCRAQWIDLKTEANLDGQIELPEPEPEPMTGCTCTDAAHEARWPWGLLVGLLALARKERS